MLLTVNTNLGMGFTKKPEARHVGKIKKSMKIARVTERGFCDHVGKGMVWIPAVMRGGTSSANFVSQQLLGLDFDNKGARGVFFPEDAVRRLRETGITPMCLYHTYSSAPRLPRFRVVIALSEPLRDSVLVVDSLKRLLNLFPEADQACKDAARLFFGTWGDNQVYRLYASDGYSRTDSSLIRSLPLPVEEKPLKSPQIDVGVRCANGADDVSSIKRSIDLVDYVRHDTGEMGYSSGSTVKFKNCPVCGHRYCFVCYPDTNSWACFSDSNTTGISGGSIIDYVMAVKDVSFRQALTILKGFRLA